MSFYPRLLEAKNKDEVQKLYNKGTGNVFLLKQLCDQFPKKYTFKTGARIENRGRVSWDELIKDIKTIVDEYSLDVDLASIQVKSLKKSEGGISDQFPTLFFNIDGKDHRVKFSGAGTGEQLSKTPTVFKEGLVCFFYSTQEPYESFSKRSPKEKEAGYNNLIHAMIKDISANGIQGINDKDKTKILDILKAEIAKTNIDVLNAIFNALSIGNKLRLIEGSKFAKWEIYRDDFFNQIKSEAATGIGFTSKASDKWNPMDILLVKPGMKKEILKRWAEAKGIENKDLKLGKYNSIFLDSLDSKNKEGIALAISLKEEKAQAGKGKSYLDSIETLKDKYNITKEEKSWPVKKLMDEIIRLRKSVNSTIKKNKVSDLFLYKVDPIEEFAKPESALSKYGSMKMLNYLMEKVTPEKNIFIDLAGYSLSLGKNPTFFKFVGDKDGNPEAVQIHKFEAKGGISLFDITKYKTFDNYDGKIWIRDSNNNAGVQITYYIVLASVVYIANLVIRTGGGTQVFIEIQKFKELKDLTENQKGDFYPRLFEKFKEQSDPVKDMGIGLSEEETLLYNAVKLFGKQRIFWKLSEEEKRNMRGRVPKYDLNRTLPMSHNDWVALKKEMGWQRVPKRYIKKVSDWRSPWASDMLKELNYAQIFSDVYGEDWYYDDTDLVQGDRTIVNLFPYPGITFKELVKKVQTSKELKIRTKK